MHPPPSLMFDTLLIYASEIAACVGANRYKSPEEAAVDIALRHLGLASVSAYVPRTDPSEPRHPIPLSATEYLEKDAHLKKEIDSIIDSGAPELRSRLDSVLKAHDVPEDITKDMKSHVYTTRGIRDEDEALNAVERGTGRKITQRNSKFYIMKVDEGLSIGGRVDGLDETGEIIEVKNRQNGFFNCLPARERMQVHAYMALLGKVSCTLVQRYNGQDRIEQIPFLEDFWNPVMSQLKTFADKLRATLNDDTALDRLMLQGDLDEPRNLLTPRP